MKVIGELSPGYTDGVYFCDDMSCTWLFNDIFPKKADLSIVATKLGCTSRLHSLNCVDNLSQSFLFGVDTILSIDGVDAEGLKLAEHLDLTAVSVELGHN